MTTLFTNKLAEEYSWIGVKSKKNFSVLQISKTIIGKNIIFIAFSKLLTGTFILAAVAKIHKNVATADIESAMKMWLVKAKERELKKKTNSDKQW